ncbi:MAG: pitrilysin family protein [Phycisphaerae bacterium]|nr:pitrilysin family protein [Phycisphaerae bacterium]
MPVTFRRAQLANGLQIVGETDPTAHSSSVGFFFRTGARDESSRLMGVSHFLEHMMFKGTAKRNAQQVNNDFDAIGASHNAYTTAEMTAYYAHVLPEHLDSATEILSDILRPSLRVEDFNEERGVILEEIAMYEDQPFWMLYERSMELFYGDHPLAHRVLGTKETIARLERDEMASYFHDRYSADNTTVAIAGRVDFDQFADRLQQLCGQWEATKPVRVHQQWNVVDRDETLRAKNATRHYLLMAMPAPHINDPQRYEATMLAHVLGDADGSRFHWSLIETGIAEEASAQYDGRDGVGEFLVSAVCDPKDAERVETICLRELAGVLEGLTDDDLLRARSKIATSVTLAGERPSGRMNRLGTIFAYNGEYVPLEQELARIEAVTIEQLRQYTERWPLTPRMTARLLPLA